MKLRTKIRALVASGAVLVTSACVPSLYPFYTVEDLVYDPAVAGTWKEGDDTWTLERSGSGYSLTIVEDGMAAEFSAHLTQLGGHRFLDIYPEGDPPVNSEFLKGHLVPAHTLWKLSLEGETMRLAALDADWLEDGLESGAVSVPHSRWGDDNGSVVLTAATSVLQQFLVAHAENARAFDIVLNLHRP
jgi:hypothetical protein